MLRNRVYYGMKPLVPFSVRHRLRGWLARRQREQSAEVWPILPGSEKPPRNWPGWPDGKKFAFVLTHDVEGQSGLDKVPRLMELERRLGFRSAFNFVPEGEYQTPRELRAQLVADGFEVGVHDLHHDGKLFLNEREFHRHADRINRHLRDWGASGFRSGFMLHNLDWIHALNLQYDASTFDTDPFEPQPQGQHTIFPFWVPHPEIGNRKSEIENQESAIGNRQSAIVPRPSPLASDRTGYVELPYTLPQDSTLFVLLGERHPDIWFQKLDWIARHGGMALVNVHPDYTRFANESPSARTFPVELYTRFLEYARQRYGDSFWQPLPREVAAHVAPHQPQLPPKPRRICMVTHSFYKSDARVTRYAEALANRGDHVDVVALRSSPDVPAQEKVGNVNLFSLQARFGKKETTRLSYLFPILRFLLASSLWMTRSHARKRYDLLHIHNVPDFLVFAGWFPKLTGTRIILDIHDIVPEFYASKFALSPSSFSVRLLKWVERAAAHFANHVIIANHLWHEKYASRTGANGRCSVFINNVDNAIFRPRPRQRSDGRLQVIFPGGLQWHQGLDIAIRAFQKVAAEFPPAEFHIYGDGNMKAAWVALADELGLGDKVRFFEPLPVRQIADLMANADLGVVPKRADSFGNEAYSTKIMEFMSVGVPVVVSSTKIDRFYFNDSIVRFFPSGDVDALADAMMELLAHPELRGQMAARGLAYAARSNWDCRRAAYLQLVDSLIAGESGDLTLPPDPSISGDGKLADTREPLPRPRELVLN